ncbi:MAG: APC family permease [Liquorilactobacillus mali]|uniref:APC family permease n=1 Tax=Liquorilactobacillus mali TaxID=1618 RepID=UPI0039EB5766
MNLSHLECIKTSSKKNSLLNSSLGAISWNTSAIYNAHSFKFSGILQATGMVILSYLGFDAIGTLAEESINPKESVGKAIIMSIIIIGFLFVITTFFAGLAYPDYSKLNTNTAFLDIIEYVGGEKLKIFAVTTIVLSFSVATCQESQTAISRILYSMGRDQIMPHQLAYLHPKFKTPVIGIILVAVVVTPLSLMISLNFISLLVSFGALVSFILLNLAVIWKFYLRQ